MDVGRGPSARNRSMSPLGKMLPAACGVALELEGGSWGGERRLVAPLVFQGGRPGVAPVFSSPPALLGGRLGAQLTVTGKALAKQRGVSLPYSKTRRGAFPSPLILQPFPTSPHQAGHSLGESPTIQTHSREENQPRAERSPIPLRHETHQILRWPATGVPVPWSLAPATVRTHATAVVGTLRGPPVGPAALPARLAGAARPGACFGPCRSVAAAPCSRCWRPASS